MSALLAGPPVLVRLLAALPVAQPSTPAVAAAGWALAAAALVLAALVVARLRAREELVTRACHELRSPLTAARLAVHGLGSQLSGVARPLAALDLELRRAGLALEDLAAAREGRRTPACPDAVDLAELLEQVQAAWAPVADAFSARLRVERPARGTLLVRADRTRLAQAVGNLVSNALEHGRGAVRVRARVTEAGVHVEVDDAGPGLPAPVGELTRRARGGRGRRGRGLAIAEEIARGHGGRVLAVPVPQGARVVLELPRLAPAARGSGRRRRAWPQARLARGGRWRRAWPQARLARGGRPERGLAPRWRARARSGR